MSNDMITAPVAMKVPSVIYAKVHGASTDVLSGQRGLMGGWYECPREGCAPMVPKAHVDALRQSLSDVAGILNFVVKAGLITEEARLAFMDKPEARAVSVGQTLDAADAALALTGGAV